MLFTFIHFNAGVLRKPVDILRKEFETLTKVLNNVLKLYSGSYRYTKKTAIPEIYLKSFAIIFRWQSVLFF